MAQEIEESLTMDDLKDLELETERCKAEWADTQQRQRDEEANYE